MSFSLNSFTPLFMVMLLFSSILGETETTKSVKSDSTTTKNGANAVPQDILNTGNKLYEKGDYLAAADQYRQATKSAKSTIDKAYAWFNLGNCHVQTKAYPKAVVAYRRSIEESPNFTRAWSVLGEVYFFIGSVGDATACFHRVLEIDGPNSRAYQLLGELALKGSDIPEALQNFEAALNLDPDQSEIYLAMSEAYTRIKDYSSAVKVMNDALVILPNPPAEVYFYLGQLYELNGDTQNASDSKQNARKAVRVYEEGLLLNPKRVEYYLRIARIHEKNGDEFLALLTLEQAVRAGIKKPEIFLKAASIYFAQGRYERALEQFKAAYALGSRQGRSGIENVAAVYFNAGDRKKAEMVLAGVGE